MHIYTGSITLPTDISIETITDFPSHSATPVISSMEARTPVMSVRAVPFRTDEVDVDPIGFENAVEFAI